MACFCGFWAVGCGHLVDICLAGLGVVLVFRRLFCFFGFCVLTGRSGIPITRFTPPGRATEAPDWRQTNRRIYGVLESFVGLDIETQVSAH